MSSLPVRDRRGSPDRFGYEWAEYNEILPESRDQLQRWLGTCLLESFAGKRVLDIGCGMGRNPYWVAMAGAIEVVAVDVDDRSLTTAKRNLAPCKSARVEKCSVYDLSDEFGQFDRVTCIGVLHHLEDPQTALQRMWARVGTSGELHLWCYGREGNRLLLPVIQSLRAIGARAPIRVTHALAKGLTLAAWPAMRYLPWRTDYYKRLKELSFRNIESIIFDQMLPRIAHYWTEQDIRDLCAPLGGALLVENVQGNSWHVRITKDEKG